MTNTERSTILVVDDIPENIDILVGILGSDYRVIFATSGQDALISAIAQPKPGLILLDVMMPGMDGYEVCRRLKADLRTQDIPIIFVTAQNDARDEAFGLSLGAVDYMHKPCNPSIIKQRVRIHLELHNQNRVLEERVQERTREIEETRIEIVRRLGRAGEYRDNETGFHVARMSHYCYCLAIAAGVPQQHAEQLKLAATMHDIGKIGIPDRILLKPGRLTDEERKIMQGHAEIGAEIIGKHAYGLLAIASTIALAHHERWDGTGYPSGLVGEDIPIEGRIASICDVFDALTSIRPYKKAWTHEEAVQYIISENGKAFDPTLVQLFESVIPQLTEISHRYEGSTETPTTLRPETKDNL